MNDDTNYMMRIKDLAKRIYVLDGLSKEANKEFMELGKTIAETEARKYDIRIGDNVKLKTQEGEYDSFRVERFYADRWIDQPVFYLSGSGFSLERKQIEPVSSIEFDEFVKCSSISAKMALTLIDEAIKYCAGKHDTQPEKMVLEENALDGFDVARMFNLSEKADLLKGTPFYRGVPIMWRPKNLAPNYYAYIKCANQWYFFMLKRHGVSTTDSAIEAFIK